MRITFVIFALAALTCCALAQTSTAPSTQPTKLILSKETTYFTSPLLPDGTIDYSKAVDEQMSKGVTTDNNAAVLIAQAGGPIVGGKRLPDDLWEKLGIKPPADDGVYMTGFVDWMRPRWQRENPGKQVPDTVSDEWYKQEAMMLDGPWRPEDARGADEWIRAMEKPAALLIEAAKRTRLYWPPVKRENLEAVSEFLSVDRNFMWFIVGRAMRAAGRNDTKSALADLRAAHQFAQLLMSAPASIDSLIAYAIEGRAYKATRAMALQGLVTREQLADLLADTLAAHDPPDGTAYIEIDIRADSLESVMETIRGNAGKVLTRQILLPLEIFFGKSDGDVGAPTLDPLDWNTALREINRIYDQVVLAIGKPCAADRQAILRDLKQLRTDAKMPGTIFGAMTSELPEDKDYEAARNRIIKEAVAFLHRRDGESAEAFARRIALLVCYDDVLDDMLKQRDLACAEQRLTVITVAIESYIADKKEPPQKLADLVGPVLKTLPLDPFSGKEFIYRKGEGNGFILYSVGPNLIDDGGKNRHENYKSDDIVVKAP